MFLHLSISFSLSAKQADLKIILLIRFFKKLKNNDFSIRKQKLAAKCLRNLPIHYLKVKKGFNAEIIRGNRGPALLGGISLLTTEISPRKA